MAQAEVDAGSSPAGGTLKGRINLERTVVVLVDNGLGLEILAQIFNGFGARGLHRCRTAAEAVELVKAFEVDLIVMDTVLPDNDGYEFVQWLRHLPEKDVNRFAPVMLLSAHTASTKVQKTRDCGANFLVAKPISPKIILERLIWVAREKRPFVETDTYNGPDRRFRQDGPPEGMAGRRRNDPQPGKVEALTLDVVLNGDR